MPRAERQDELPDPLTGASVPLWIGSPRGASVDPSKWSVVSFVDDHVSVVADPLGSDAPVYRFSIPEGDRPYHGACAPRADMLSSYLLAPDGTTHYIGFSVLLPDGQIPAGIAGGANSFMQVAQIKDTATRSSPPIELGLRARTRRGPNHWIVSLGPNTSRYGSWAAVWRSEHPVDAQWHNFVWEITASRGNTNTGSLRMWMDGCPQTFTSQTSLLHGISTSYNGAPQPLDINFYRAPGLITNHIPTVYHDSPVIGTSYASVVPPIPSGPRGGHPIPPRRALSTAS